MDLENTKIEVLSQISNSSYLFRFVPIVDFGIRDETKLNRLGILFVRLFYR